MNNCRKSDRPVVPEKSSNKPREKGAEEMEGRGMPKENKIQQNTLRTQRRVSVLSELQLIHQRAKADKKNEIHRPDASHLQHRHVETVIS